MAKKNKEEIKPEENINQQAAETAESTETPAEEPVVQMFEITAEQMQLFEDKIKELEAKCAEEHDRYLRVSAEYDNYRKRSSKEREGLYADVKADTISKLLPVYDNLERAIANECADEAYAKGVEMTMTQLREIFAGLGVTEIPGVGEQFPAKTSPAILPKGVAKR